MFTLKKCTGDDSLFATRNHKGIIKYWSTDHTLLTFDSNEAAEPNNMLNSTPVPSFTDLARASPSKSQQKARVPASDGDPDICRICEIRYESREDIETDSPWMGCVSNACTYWVHAHCKGFPDLTEEDVNNINVYCNKHNPKKQKTIKPKCCRTRGGKRR